MKQSKFLDCTKIWGLFIFPEFWPTNIVKISIKDRQEAIKFRLLWLSITQLSRTINWPIQHWAAPGGPAVRTPRGSINLSTPSCYNPSSQHGGLSWLGTLRACSTNKPASSSAANHPFPKEHLWCIIPTAALGSFHSLSTMQCFQSDFTGCAFSINISHPGCSCCTCLCAAAWGTRAWVQVRPSPRSYSKFQVYLLIANLVFQQLIPLPLSSLILSWI